MIDKSDYEIRYRVFQSNFIYLYRANRAEVNCYTCEGRRCGSPCAHFQIEDQDSNCLQIKLACAGLTLKWVKPL